MKKLLAIAAFVAASVGMLATDATTSPATPPPMTPVGPARPALGTLGLGGLFNRRVDVSKLPADLQALIQQFRTQREALMTSRKALFDSLKDMTKDQRKAAVQAWEAANRDSVIAERQLAKQIREQLKTLRKEHQRTTPPGG